MPRFVDEEQIAGVVKVLSLEVFYSELQSNFVDTQFSRIHGSLAEVQRNLLRRPKGQCHGFGRLGHRAWLDHRSGAGQTHRVLGSCCNACETEDQ